MIRQATFDDMAAVEAAWDEHFTYEMEHGAVTVFRKGVYPTRADAEKAVRAGALYVCEQDGELAGSVIANETQPEEYQRISWSRPAAPDEVMVIHLIMVRPRWQGRGIASSLIKYLLELAAKRACTTVRLDTGAQNIPALSLYHKLGFQTVAGASMKVGGVIAHSGHLFLEKLL